MTPNTLDDSASPTPESLAPPPLRVAVIVGSVRRGRLADPLLAWLTARIASRSDLVGHTIDLADVDLPLTHMGTDEITSPISADLDAADAILVLTPEYNHSIPAALKNALDWHRDEWARKPVGVVAYGAASGGLRAVEHLRLVFPELHAMTTRNVVAISEPWSRIDAGGTYTPTDSDEGALSATLRELTWWARVLRPARQAER